MQDATPLYTRHEGAPVPPGLGMLVALTGHMDAGRVARQVRAALHEHLTHRTVVSFDLDSMFDYRARRPRLRFDRDRYRDLRLPTLEVQLVEDLLGHPFLLLSGPEPDFRWHAVTEAVLGLAQEWEVDSLTFLDAAPLPVPHTRRLGVTTHGSRADAVEGLSTWSPEADIVAGLLQMLELRAEEADLPTAGYTVHVPHYVAEASFPQAAVAAQDCGAVVSFSGVIRDHDGGRSGVTGLEYSAHPDADSVIRQVAEEIAVEFPSVRIWAEHRIGSLVVGDSALEAAVASAHRKEAFAACDALVDRIKLRVPIWKRQTYTDGTHSWVGLDG